MTDLAARTRCRVLVAGFGRPGMRDLDFGRSLTQYLEGLDWPEDVVVEDLSCAPTLVLHRLRELEPEKVVLVGAVARDFDAPGTLRRHEVGGSPPSHNEVQLDDEWIPTVIDIDHTLAAARQWGALPVEAVVIEVEPADCSFGSGFSDELAGAFDSLLALVREEVDSPGSSAPFEANAGEGTVPDSPSAGPSPVEVVSRSHSSGTDRCGRWFEVIPLDAGWIGLVMGDIGGRGAAADEVADLRAAFLAYAVISGPSAGQVVRHLDQLVHRTGVGADATLVYLALRAETGELRLSNAGHCLPLLVDRDEIQFLGEGTSSPLGTCCQADRPEANFLVPPGGTLLLFSDGLAGGRTRNFSDAMRQAVTTSGHSLDELCDRMLTLADDEEAWVVGVRRP